MRSTYQQFKQAVPRVIRLEDFFPFELPEDMRDEYLSGVVQTSTDALIGLSVSAYSTDEEQGLPKLKGSERTIVAFRFIARWPTRRKSVNYHSYKSPTSGQGHLWVFVD